MAYTPTTIFSTPHKMRLMLSECATVRKILEVGTAADALAKIWTYGQVNEDGIPKIEYPRILIKDEEIQMRTDQDGQLLDIDQRILEIWAGFYVPDIADIQDVNDEHAWVLDQFGAINDEMLALTGKGNPLPGLTHLFIENPVFFGVEREPDDERGDPDMDVHPCRPRWFGLIQYTVN